MKIIWLVLVFGFAGISWAQAGQSYTIVNSGGFIQRGSDTSDLPTDLASAQVALSRSDDGAKLTLSYAGSVITLYRIEVGIASLNWTPQGSVLLGKQDVLSLSGKDSFDEVDAWGAVLDWPQVGLATMVLFEAGKRRLAGFLVSSPNGSKVVRQMELQELFGPARHRPILSRRSEE